MTKHILSKVERLLLRNQYLILKKLYPDQDFDNELEILQDGHELYYEELFNAIYSGASFEDGDFVADVLEMFRDIEHWLRANKGSRANEEPLHHFMGFDGNNESELFGFTKYVLLKRGFWQELRQYARSTDNFNSHMVMRPTYERMRSKWREIGRRRDYTEDQILSILRAAKETG